eukprot:g25659.t1
MTEETPLRPGRAIISGEVYKIDGKEVVLMGGNYVVKAKPYYPPLEIVRKDAKLMAEGAALPSKGNNIDASFATTLEAVVKAFKDEGVYVFLDMHQDAFGTTNGGDTWQILAVLALTSRTLELLRPREPTWYENVVAVELINEPLFAGLPDVCYALTVWNQILSFQADVLEALDADPSVPKCPIAVANFGSTVEGESCFIKLLSCWGLPSNVKKRFDSYAKQERLILAFHYYVPPATSTFEEVIQLAKLGVVTARNGLLPRPISDPMTDAHDAERKKNAQQLGGTIPIFLSEFFQGSAQAKADQLAVAVDQGVNAVTYWHYADTEFTGQGGWFIYPESTPTSTKPRARPGLLHQSFTPPARDVRAAGSRVSNRVKAQNPVVCFLCDIGLPQYVDAILRNGFDDIETLAEMREEAAKRESMGFLPGHALKLKKRLREFIGEEAPSTVKTVSEPSNEPSLDPGACKQRNISAENALSVQQSWAEVRKLGVSTVGHTFYKHMFQLVPEARKLFPMTFRNHFADDGLFHVSLEKAIQCPPAPVLEHFTRVLEAIGSAVAGLQNKERMVPQLLALGMKHATLGLEEILGACLVPCSTVDPPQESWSLVYGFMSANMIAGFRDFRSKEAQVADFRAEIQRTMKKSEKTKSDPEKLRSLAEKISGQLKADKASTKGDADLPNLLTATPTPSLPEKVKETLLVEPLEEEGD